MYKTLNAKFKSKGCEISSNTFIIIISLYLSYVLNLSFIKSLFLNFEVTNISQLLCLVFAVPMISVPIILILNLILVKYTIKTISCLFLLISSATNYFMYELGTLIDYDMVRSTFETTVREATDLITLPAILWTVILGVIPVVLVCKVKIKFYSFKKELIRRSSLAGILILVTLIYCGVFGKILFSFGRNNENIGFQYNTLNYTVNTIRFIKNTLKPKKKFKILDENVYSQIEDKDIHVVVLVVGETARTKNFSIYGYEKETTPLLGKNPELIKITNTTSCATITYKSVPCMFSPKDRQHFDVENAEYEENLLDFLTKAGWNVDWYENDDGCKAVCKRVNYYKASKLGQNSDQCFGDYCYDGILLDFLDQKLKEITQNTVIVLHTMGSHGPTYYKRYPKQFEKFTPTCDTENIPNCSLEEVVNTYDNTILYTDYIISSVIDKLKEYKNMDSSVLYASDHGESLGEKGIYLHGLPYSVAPEEQKRVPFVMWLSKKTIKNLNIDFECLKNKDWQVSSHDNWFHTVLGLTKTNSSLYKKDLDLLSTCKK